MSILSGHIVELNDLKLRNDNESILSNRSNFIAVQSILDESDTNGNYIVYETKIHTYFRSGTTEVGMVKRLNKHTSVNMRSNYKYSSKMCTLFILI